GARRSLGPRGGSHANGAQDTVAHTGRRVLQACGPERLEDPRKFVEAQPGRRVGGQPGLEVGTLLLAGISVQGALDQVIERFVHDASTPMAPRISPSRARAEKRRDFTVFAGTCSASAISSYDRSSQCLSTMTSR